MSALKNCMLGLQSAADCDWHSAVDDSEVDSANQSVDESAHESDCSASGSDCDSWSAVSVSPRRPKASIYPASSSI